MHREPAMRIINAHKDRALGHVNRLGDELGTCDEMKHAQILDHLDFWTTQYTALCDLHDEVEREYDNELAEMLDDMYEEQKTV